MSTSLRGAYARFGRAAIGLLGAAILAGVGCGGNTQVSTTGTASGGGGGVITGVGGGTSSSSSSGMGGDTTTPTDTDTDPDDPKLGAPYPIVLCHGFFGFDKLAKINGLPYFFNVPEYIEEQLGETEVYAPAVDPFNSSDYRADQLIEIIEAIIKETGREKVVLIGHSQGGLDARAVASLRPDLVAAVVTVATPHFGSPVADIALNLVSDPMASALIDALAKLIAAPLYDQVGNETSVAKALYLFSQPGSAEFNLNHPDSPGVFYASITGRTDWSLGGQVCAPDVELPFVTDLNGDKDAVDPLFALTESLIDGGIGNNDPNDGLVRVEDAKWGEFWGCVPADHMDEVGQLDGDGPGLGNGYHHDDMFVGIIKHLRAEGF